jgi:two-component system nitrogen regulation response regulator NtrX
LFGHEEGAFTGAKRQRKGKFEQADGGTLFLDEVGDMGAMTQAKVLRVLQENMVQRVGGEAPVQVDVRVIAATNKDLKQTIEAGDFREDLYYRLNIIAIEVPPLRARREDIPELVDHFLGQVSATQGVPQRTITSNALGELVGREWPGNVRQLRNVVERLVALSEGPTIRVDDLDRALQSTRESSAKADDNDLRTAREQFERSFIRRTLHANDGIIKDTAKALGIDRSHLWKKMKQYDIESP